MAPRTIAPAATIVAVTATTREADDLAAALPAPAQGHPPAGLAQEGCVVGIELDGALDAHARGVARPRPALAYFPFAFFTAALPPWKSPPTSAVPKFSMRLSARCLPPWASGFCTFRSSMSSNITSWWTSGMK